MSYTQPQPNIDLIGYECEDCQASVFGALVLIDHVRDEHSDEKECPGCLRWFEDTFIEAHQGICPHVADKFGTNQIAKIVRL